VKSTGDDGSTNNAFGNSIKNLTIDVGRGNPGAVGIDYLANNIGVIRDVTILSPDRGYAGILMTRDAIGPCLIKNVQITGFDFALKAANTRSSFTVDSLRIRGQAVAGIATSGNNFTVNGLISENRVVAIRETLPVRNLGPVPGFMVLIDSRLGKGSDSLAAISDSANLFIRNLSTDGYKHALAGRLGNLPGGLVSEFHTGSAAKPISLRNGSSLGLIQAEPPGYWDNNPVNWHIIPPPDGSPEKNAVNIAAAFASGKTTILFRPGTYELASSILVRGPVRNIIGNGTVLQPIREFSDSTRPKPLIVIDHASPFLIMQNLTLGHWQKRNPGLICMEHSSRRRLVLKDVLMWDDYMESAYRARSGAGDVYLENVSNQGSTGWHFSKGQKIHAKQLNLEGRKTKIMSEGAVVSILGMKTESTGAIIENRAGGRAELLGGYFLNWNPYTAPAFINEDSDLSVSYFHEADKPEFCYSVHVREKHGKDIRVLNREQVSGNPYRCAIPLYTSRAADFRDRGGPNGD
jgi:hypothetical protein